VPGPYIDTTDLLTFVAGTLHVTVATLPAEFTTMAGSAITIGYSDLLTVYLDAAYTIAQIDASDTIVGQSLSQSLFRLGFMAGGFGDYPPGYFKEFDLREALSKTLAVSSAGVAVAPGPSAIGGISHGRNSAVDHDKRHWQCEFGYTKGSRYPWR